MIDGEYYNIEQPKELSISLDKNYPKGIVKFLSN